MIRRFQIEDLILQDAGGVIFGAFDSETQRHVSLRRFFPFGAEGGGLEEEEQAAYTIAVARLSGVHHPGLRSVIAGGCDPVDGMPYIATERVDGISLDRLVAHEPLAAADAVALLTRALEVSAVLSQVLAEEAIWVETDLRMIEVSSEESGRGFTFWISPLKWLGGDDGHRGLESIVTLTEEIMHWRGQLISDQAGRGLGGWLKWLRAVAATTNIREAMEMLAAATGVEPPPPVATLVRQATIPLAPSRVSPGISKIPLAAVVVLTLAVAGMAYWGLVHRNGSQVAGAASPVTEAGDPVDTFPASASATPTIPPPTEASAEDPTARINRLAAEMSAQSARSGAELDARRRKIQEAGGVYSAEDRDLLRVETGREVAVGGTLAEIRNSKTNTYLFFTQSGGEPQVAGVFVSTEAPPGLLGEELQSLVGRKIVVRGKLRSEFGRRLLVTIGERSAIETVE